MIEALPHDPNAFSLVPEANRSKIGAQMPFIVSGHTKDGSTEGHPIQRALRTELDAAVSELSRAARTDNFSEGQRVIFDYYDWQEAMDRLDSLLTDYAGTRLQGLEQTVYAGCVCPAQPGPVQVFHPDLKFSVDMDIMGLVMPPSVDKYDMYVRRGGELNFKVRDIMAWLLGKNLSVQAGTVLDLKLRLQSTQGTFEDTIQRVLRNINGRVRSHDVAKLTVFGKVMTQVYEAYSDVIEPVRPTEILLRAKLAYNSYVYNQNYMEGFWRGDLGVGSTGGKPVGWIPVGDRSAMMANGVDIGLITVDLAKGKTSQGIVNRVTHTRPVMLGQETTTLGNGLTIRYEDDKDFYPVRGDAIGGFVKKSPKSIFEGVEPHVTNLISRIGPFPMFPYSTEGMEKALTAGNISVLSGAESYVLGSSWHFDPAKGVWVCSARA
jgi:hypothetical protein